MTNTKRFIAGAICPSCNEADTMQIDNGNKNIECIDCGYIQTAQERDSKSYDSQQPAPQKNKFSSTKNTRAINIINIDNSPEDQ